MLCNSQYEMPCMHCIFSAVLLSLTPRCAGWCACMSSQTVTLTTGPLVIALRPDNVPAGHVWPPTATSIETIAASYVPVAAGQSGVRLFNLSPDTAAAGANTRETNLMKALFWCKTLCNCNTVVILPGQTEDRPHKEETPSLDLLSVCRDDCQRKG